MRPSRRPPLDRVLVLVLAFGAAGAGVWPGESRGAEPRPGARPKPAAVPIARPRAIDQACAAGAWVQAAGITAPITSVAGSSDFEFLFAGSLADGANHLFRGEAADDTWAAVADMAAIEVAGVAVGPGVDPTVWAAEVGGGVYSSRSGGSTFQASAGLPGDWVTALAPVTQTVLAAASEPSTRGIYAWDPAGDTWSLRGGNAIDTEIFYDLEVDAGGAVWLATEGAGVWVSGDGGVTWRAMDIDGRVDTTVLAVAVDPGAPQVVYAGHGPTRSQSPGVGAPDAKGAHVSADGGVTWRPVLQDVDVVTAIAPLSMRPGAAYASGWGRGLLYTIDGGLTWRGVPGPVDEGNPDAGKFIEALAAVTPRGVPGDCELLVAGGADGVWLRNVAPLTYHSVYLPSAACGSAHCAGAVATGRGTRPLPRRVGGLRPD